MPVISAKKSLYSLLPYLLCSIYMVRAVPMFNGEYHDYYLNAPTPVIDNYEIPLIYDEEPANQEHHQQSNDWSNQNHQVWNQQQGVQSNQDWHQQQHYQTGYQADQYHNTMQYGDHSGYYGGNSEQQEDELLSADNVEKVFAAGESENPDWPDVKNRYGDGIEKVYQRYNSFQMSENESITDSEQDIRDGADAYNIESLMSTDDYLGKTAAERIYYKARFARSKSFNY